MGYLTIRDIPTDQIPFPVIREGVLGRFVLVSRADYEEKIRPGLHPAKVKLIDIYAEDPVNTLGVLEDGRRFDIIRDIADIIARVKGIRKTESPPVEEIFKRKLIEKLVEKGFKIVTDTDVTRTVDVSPNVAHRENEKDNLFKGHVGKLLRTYDPSVPDGRVREECTLQVMVAEKR